jgi:site-specific DNA-methyltransferase (adenine-specific)
MQSPAKMWKRSVLAEQDKIHPTQKPVALYEWIIKNYAKESDKILDTHLGSGSSRIAAHKANLPFMGFELDEDYFKASVKRFEQYVPQTRLF